MKLITHNMLSSKCLRGVTTGYPLTIIAKDVKVSEVDFNQEFVSRILPRLDWNVLWQAADRVRVVHSRDGPDTGYLLDSMQGRVLDIGRILDFSRYLGHVGELPQNLIENYENDPEFLKKVHHVLFEVEVINGELVCPETGRKFPITSGIPNMLLNDDEV